MGTGKNQGCGSNQSGTGKKGCRTSGATGKIRRGQNHPGKKSGG